MSLMENDIEGIYESSECQVLETLLLQKNSYLATISGEFFRSMSRLLLLDLSRNKSLCLLPEKISRLVSLRYLDLSHTSITRLPVGLQELRMLTQLNLEWTESLESLDGISNLSSLKTLKLVYSKVWLDMSVMKELQLLEHIEFVSINISSSFVGKLSVYDPRVVRSIQHLSIKERPEEESVRVLLLPVMDNLCKIWISECGMREMKIENKKSPCFSNLSYVEIGGCDSLKDLTWLMFAPSLIHLTLMELKQLEYIISKEKETCNIIPFEKLEYLQLVYLPELKSIYWNALPFKRLRRIYIYDNCPKLRKLPLDSKSAFKVEEFVIECEKEEWIQGIEWEDEASDTVFYHHVEYIKVKYHGSDDDDNMSNTNLICHIQ